MARLSIVIPLLGDAKNLDDTLVSVLENRPANCEVLVVCNQAYDDPYELGDEVCFLEARRGARLAECLNLALAACRAPVVHVLSCGVEVCPGWADAALRRFREADVAAVTGVVLDGDGRVASAGVGYRAEGTISRVGRGQEALDVADWADELCGPDLLAAFYRRSVLEEIGGFASFLNEQTVGADLALALQQAGHLCVLEPQCLAHVAAAVVADKPSLARGCDAERLFWHWAASNGWMSSLIGHAALLVGECVISPVRPRMIAQLAGRCFGALQAIGQGRRLRPNANDRLAPIMAPGPHLAIGTERVEQQPSARVA